MESQPAAAKGRHKIKSKKSNTKAKIPKKTRKAENKNEGPTCSMFLADLTRKLQMKRKHEADVEMSKNIVHTIIDRITSALPVTVSRKTIEKPEPTPVNIEQLQSFAPELLPRDTIEVPLPKCEEPKHDYQVHEVSEIIIGNDVSKSGFKIPRMPLITSDVLKPKMRLFGSMHDIAVNTGGDHDVASEIARHVGTLRKISLIAEEFNQKTAKNLKEIVDSVQEDLIKKLEEVQAEQRKRIAADLTLAAAKAAEDEAAGINTGDESIDD